MSQSPDSKETHASKIVDGKNSFTGAAIKGSSLLNTVGDIRSFVQRGSTILINNVPYEVSLTGEWNSNSVQLSTDYSGETNFSVNILIPDGSFSPKKKKSATSTNSSKAVDMKQMVQGLDSITETFGAKLRQQDAAARPVVTKTKKPVISLKAPPAAAVESEPYVDNTIRKNLPKKLPPLPASSSQNDNTDNDVDDEDSIDASREKAPQKPTPALVPAKAPTKAPSKARHTPLPKQETSTEESSRPNSVKDGGLRPKPPQEKKPPKARSKPPKPVSSTPPAVTTPVPTDPSLFVPPANLKTVEEERRAALLRVRQKAKEVQAALEKAAAAKEEELKAIREASENRAKELQARTALRVEQYMAEKQRKLEQQKDLEKYEEEQRQLRKQQFLNPSRHMKMKQIRKEAQQRLDRLAYEDLVKAQIAEEHVQKSLFERHKKYDVNTTFLPRLDGPLAQGSSTNSSSVAGSGQDYNPPPGRVVKSIAAELERFEMDSGTFPEEPILRSRSAKQPKRTNGANGTNGNAPRPDSLPVIRGAQSINPVASAPAVRSNHQQHPRPSSKQKASAPTVRDEDEWSEDEPDPIQEAAMHAHANRRNNDLDEDSLNFGSQDNNDDEEDEGAVLERQIFGQAAPVAAVSHQRVLGQQVHAAPGSIQQHSKSVKPPVGKKKTPRRSRNGDFDENASECSDITIDSMLGGNAKAQQQRNNRTKKVHTPNKTATHNHKNPFTTEPTNKGLPTIAVASAATSQMFKQAPYPAPQSLGAPMQSPVWPAGKQQEITFAPRAPAPQIIYQAPVSLAGSSPSVSPNKPKKNTFKKLKPIPISAPYQPVIKVYN